MLKIFLAAVLVASTQAAFLFGKSAPWDDLKLTFGVNPFKYGSKYFVSQPRTVKDAIKAGWKLDASCSKTASFRGNRYIKGEDRLVMLLYDKSGYIVGIQASLSKALLMSQKRNYPSKYSMKYFIDEGSMYTITAYFVNPGKVDICGGGRSQSQFNTEGTGNGLWIQMGNPETDLMTIPVQESGMAATEWSKGKCFPGMGVHYWYDILEDMSCEKLVPLFILYNKGKLNGFGWAFNAELHSDKLEHPDPAQFRMFMEPVPKCLPSQGVLSTMHIYMDSTPYVNLC